MRSDTVLDYAVFQLSPKHSRCEVFVSSNGQTEKLASGLIKPFANNLRVLEAQAAQGVQSSIRLEVEKCKDAEIWFTKGTLERFVQFVNDPEALERVGALDLEMSQLEAARKLYSQGDQDWEYGGSDHGGGMADATKKELSRAIELRLDAVKKDLTIAISNASASGFNADTVSELQQFADRFGAHRLEEACSKFISLWHRRPDLINLQKLNLHAQTGQSSRAPDMSVDESTDDTQNVGMAKLPEANRHRRGLEQANVTQKQNPIEQSEHHMQVQQHSKTTEKVEEDKKEESCDESSIVRASHNRRLSVQDRINLFESKQKENSNSGGKPVPPARSTELRRLSSDVSSAATSSEKSVLRRWSIVSDVSIDLPSDKNLDSSTEIPHGEGNLVPKECNGKDRKCEGDSGNDVGSIKIEPESDSDHNVGDQEASQHRMKSSTAEAENTKDSKVAVTSEAPSGSTTDSNDSSDVTESLVTLPLRHSRSLSAHIEGGMNFKVKDVHCRDNDEDMASKPRRRSLAVRGRKTEIVPPEKQPASTDSQRTEYQKPASAGSEQRKKSSGERDDANDDLRMKANELEKLFSEQKLRVSGYQSNSSGHGKQGESGVLQPQHSHSRGVAVSKAYPHQFVDKSLTTHPLRGSGDFSKLITLSGGTVAGGKSNGDTLRRNFSDLSFSDDSRGKFYEKYMQKREAKLREEWSSKRDEKETKLKFMQEALEQSRSEMKVKFSASSERQSSLSSTRQRAEKFRSFNSRPSIKKYQHPISSFQNEGDEDFSEYSDQKSRAKDKASSNGQVIGNSVSRSSQGGKVQTNRNVSSVTARIATSVPKPTAKASNTNAGRQRFAKSPLAQSVPNFSDLKKENTKPSSLVAKTTTRTQGRNAARSKNQNGDILPGKQEKLRRPQSLRKSFSGNIEFTELSTLCSADMLPPAKVDEEKNQRKTIDAGFVSELRTSDISEDLKNDEYDELGSEAEGFDNTAKEEQLEEPETVEVGDGGEDGDEKSRTSEECEKVENSRTEDDNSSLRYSSQVDPGSIADLPATVPSMFRTVASLMDSPGESPLSWNSNTQHPFGYPHEHSDFDASVDSPMGSPASWSSRMRKKWGAAQNPVMATNASQHQSRKDLTKGFKRLLKFGRKSRAAESFMDWVSVTTSEGDDDADDRRDLANRSSDDLRKSRMGSLQSHLFEDGFNESEFNDQASNSSISAPSTAFKLKEDQFSGSSNKAPRSSFFSLSTFRSKGNDLKPR